MYRSGPEGRKGITFCIYRDLVTINYKTDHIETGEEISHPLALPLKFGIVSKQTREWD